MSFLSSFWGRWFSPAARDNRTAVPRRARRKQNNLSFEGLEDRRMLKAITGIQEIAEVTQWQSGQTSLSLNVGTAVGAGHSVIVMVAMSSVTGTVSVSDSAGNTYSKDADVNNSGNVRTLIFSANGITSIPVGGTITVSFPGTATAKAIGAGEFDGLLAPTSLDLTSTNTGFSTSPSSGGTATTSQASEQLIGAIGIAGTTSNTFTGAGGWLAVPGVGTSNGSNDVTIYGEIETVSSTASYQATGTLGSWAQYAAAIATYKADPTTHTKFSSQPAAATAGSSFSVTVQARTAVPTTDTGYTGTIHFTSTDPSAVLPANYTYTLADAGQHTFTVTLKTAGNQTITATDMVDGTVTGVSSSSNRSRPGEAGA